MAILTGCRACCASAAAPLNTIQEAYAMGATPTELIELCCSPVNALTSEADAKHISAARLSLHNGYDFNYHSAEVRAK